MNYFEKLNQVDVSEHIEKKGQFNYLSWSWAIETLGKIHPDAIIKTKVNEQGFPAFYAPNHQAMVWVTVEIDNVVRGQPYPVLDYRNQAVENPDIFQINTSLQRALVKAISLHGLGLYIYAGEDLPPDAPAYTPQQKKQFDTLLDEDDDLAFWLFVQNLSNETQLALHSSFTKGSITKMKKKSHDKESKGSVLFVELRDVMSDYIEKSDHAGLEEISLELGKEGKALAFHQLPANIQQLAREMK